MFNKLIRPLKQFQRDIPKLVETKLKDGSAQISAMVEYQQIYKQGINIHGEKLKRLGAPYTGYSARHQAYKESIGAYQGHIDLNVEGDYLDSIKTRVGGGEIEVFATDSKAAELGEFYPDHLGLTDENLEVVKQTMIKPYLIVKLREKFSV